MQAELDILLPGTINISSQKCHVLTSGAALPGRRAPAHTSCRQASGGAGGSSVPAQAELNSQLELLGIVLAWISHCLHNYKTTGNRKGANLLLKGTGTPLVPRAGTQTPLISPSFSQWYLILRGTPTRSSLGWRSSPLLTSHPGPRPHCGGSRGFHKCWPFGRCTLPDCRKGKPAASQKQFHSTNNAVPDCHNEVCSKYWHTHKILIKITCVISNIGMQSTGPL